MLRYTQHALAAQDRELYEEFESAVASISSVQPITARTEQILEQYFDFTTSKVQPSSPASQSPPEYMISDLGLDHQ